MMDALISDLRHGARRLAKRPLFTAIAVLILAFGVGGSTTIFSAVRAVWSGALPYEQADRLVVLRETATNGMIGSVSGPNFDDWQQASRSFDALAAMMFHDVSLTSVEPSIRALSAGVSPELERVLGAHPVLGRVHTEAEPHVVMLSHDAWQRLLGGRPDIIGHEVWLDGEPHDVVGVWPEGFHVTSVHGSKQPADITFPLDRATSFTTRGDHGLQVIGRLVEGTTVLDADAELKAIAARIAEQYPDSQGDRSVVVESLAGLLTRRVREPLRVLSLAVALFLLISVANVAGLLLEQGAARSGELSVRAALGASRGRLVRQLLVESLLLAGLGAVLGMVLAMWGIDFLRAGFLADLGHLVSLRMDLGVLAFSLLVTGMTALLVGLWPALVATRLDLQAGLVQGAARATPSKAGLRARQALLMGQLAASVVLLVGAGLLTRSLVKLVGVDPGFRTEKVLSFNVQLPYGHYTDGLAVQSFYRGLEAELSALPGVLDVGMVSFPPLSPGNINGDFAIEGREAAQEGRRPLTEYQVVNPDYFQAMDIPLLTGRALGASDLQDAPPVAVINQKMASRYFPEGDAVGSQLRIGWLGDDPIEVVGVVADVKRWSLDSADSPQTYVPIAQRPVHRLTVLVHTASAPLAQLESVRAALARVDPSVPLFEVDTVENIVASSIATERFYALLLVIFASMATVLSAVGTYGLIAHQVRQRSGEVAIRLALGASPRSVRALFLRQAAPGVAGALVLGIAGSLLAGRVLASALYGVSTFDLPTLVAVVLLLGAVAFLAVWLPASKAGRADPMDMLRSM
jgi:putative ABC transport system permease protein